MKHETIAWLMLIVLTVCGYVDAQSCSVADQSACSGIQVCSGANVTTNGTCVVKGLFSPFRGVEEGVSTVIVVVAGSMAASGGIGGGGMLVPIYLLLLGAGDAAIPLSTVTVCGAAIANFIVTIRKRHPTADRPLIDYSVVTMFGLPSLPGSILGALLYLVLPFWLVTIFLIIVLVISAYRTIRKGFLIYKREAADEARLKQKLTMELKVMPDIERDEKPKQLEEQQTPLPHIQDADALTTAVSSTVDEDVLPPAAAEEEEEQPSVDTEQQMAVAEGDHPVGEGENDDDVVRSAEKPEPSEADDTPEETSPVTGTTAAVHEDGDTAAIPPSPIAAVLVAVPDTPSPAVKDAILLDKIKSDEAKIPVGKLLIVLITWVVMLISALLKGSKTNASLVGIPCNSVGYWLLTMLPLPVILVCVIILSFMVRRTYLQKESCGYTYEEGDIVWKPRALILYPLICFLAGVLTAMLGIGGGMIMNPLMLELGMLPQVTVATCAFLILITSSATTVQYLIFGSVSYEYAAWFGAAGFLAGLLGELIIGAILHKFRKQAIVVLMIGCVIALSVVALGYIGIAGVVAKGFDGFTTTIPCPSTQ